MRRFLALAILGVAFDASAQTLPRLEPLPEPPPAPPGMRDIEPAERGVRIPGQGDKVDVIIGEPGRPAVLRVTPPNANPYYLHDTTGNGNWMRRDSLDDGVRVPMWTIRSFD